MPKKIQTEVLTNNNNKIFTRDLCNLNQLIFVSRRRIGLKENFIAKNVKFSSYRLKDLPYLLLLWLPQRPGAVELYLPSLVWQLWSKVYPPSPVSVAAMEEIGNRWKRLIWNRLNRFCTILDTKIFNLDNYNFVSYLPHHMEWSRVLYPVLLLQIFSNQWCSC